LQNPVDTTSFNFFNFYAGQKNASKSPGAFCVFRDGLDAADTKRFPESKYGPVINPANTDAYQKQLQRKQQKDASMSDDNGDDDSGDDGSDEGINASNIKNDFLSQERINKILDEFSQYGARRGDVNSDSSSVAGDEGGTTSNDNYAPRNPNRQGRRNGGGGGRSLGRAGGKKNQAGGGKSTAYQDKRESNMVINDIGVNLIPDNYYKFLTQYSPNTTSRGYWRVGPTDQPYGRFARAFDAQNNMTEMFFTLDKNFFADNSKRQSVGVRIIYLDQGNGSWSLNYYNGSKKEAYQVKCNNTGRWITKIVSLDDAYFNQKLEHNCDLSIKYLSGDNTIFNSIEVLRR
jgi:hypothetical protein